MNIPSSLQNPQRIITRIWRRHDGRLWPKRWKRTKIFTNSTNNCKVFSLSLTASGARTVIIAIIMKEMKPWMHRFLSISGDQEREIDSPRISSTFPPPANLSRSSWPNSPNSMKRWKKKIAF